MRILKINLHSDYDKQLHEALDVLRKGGTVVYPTDTIYGLGCNALDYKAVETVYRIKDRPLEKPLSIIARNIDWVKELAVVPTKLEPILQKLWPGAITVILPKKSSIPSVVTGGSDSVGIRVPDFEFTEKLLGKFGYPIVSTSANMAGSDTDSWKISAVIEDFKPRMWQPDLVLDAGDLHRSAPSTVIDFTAIKPKILRMGAVKPSQIDTILNINLSK